MTYKYSVLFFLLLLLINCNSKGVLNSKEIVQKNARIQLVSDKFSFTEGPASDSFGNVYFTDQPNDKIYFWDWKTNKIAEFRTGSGRANGTFFDKNDNLITCSDEKGQILKISKSGIAEILTTDFNGKRLNGPNDLWLDGKGGIYFTDPLYVRDYWQDFYQEIFEKNLYYRNSEGKITKLDTFTQPNGIVGSQKLKKLYVSDIDANKTYVYDILGEGKLGNKKLFCDLGSDGMTLDNLGNLYLTGKGVTVFDKNGTKILNIAVPENWTANVTFGGENFSTLFVTASKSVYTLKMNVAGIK
ncbi:gluconolactonase [Cloacibacterium rupense]|uniref:Gluconolactonase n=1 Tax=Cloacibacterium rupense TaxID=517423 RepID=A0ABQ2NH26_9FLAO|nr:SMP-30/gluconolactonase/LRE family protein [Cloacibacterium rupense]GGP01496.1 gluconolactonase [Cloacibacterium rupense]